MHRYRFTFASACVCRRERLCKDQIDRTKLGKLNYANAEKSICRFIDHIIISLQIYDLQLNFTEFTSPPQYVKCIFKKYWDLCIEYICICMS